MEKSTVTLFERKADCCACGACLSACPKHAIRMREDGHGYLYPVIDNDLCVGCQLCRRVCAFVKPRPALEAVPTFAAASRDEALLLASASGGVFAELALQTLRDGGVVFGAALEAREGRLVPRHIRVEEERGLAALQGSKYVQSDTGDTFRQVRELLRDGRSVLFSGTPCQVDGLKGYLQQPYEQLLTADILCHGVPSARMFADFSTAWAQRLGGEPAAYSFREQHRGQDKLQLLTVRRADGSIAQQRKIAEMTSYMWFFDRAASFRECCYRCPYAASARPGDITLGDFWGIYIEHGATVDEHGMSNETGISCVLANTPKGEAALEAIQPRMHQFHSTLDSVRRHNAQLNHPSPLPACRDALLAAYQAEGYAGVERLYQRQISWKKPLYWAAGKTPRRVKRAVKSAVWRLKGGHAPKEARK